MSWRGQRGFTLVEVLVSTGIMGIMVTLVGSGVFQAMTLSGKANSSTQAQQQTRLALQWMARDIPMARSTSLVDGATPVTSSTFTWTDQYGYAQTPHSVAYTLNGGQVRRTYDGFTTTIARNMVSLSFSRSGKLITVTLNAQSTDRFQTSDQKTLRAMLRGSGTLFTPPCDLYGQPAPPGYIVITGTTGNDVISGTAADELIFGLGGSDTINGNGGNDLICTLSGGGGNDTITTGSGDDSIDAGGGNDTINAGDGNNVINAGDGNNQVTTGSGHDTITAGSGGDTINAGDGNNIVNAGDGNNQVTTGSGHDTITAGSGGDTIDAGDGNNTISAGNGNNQVTAGNGDDVITTGTGNDTINADGGNNTINDG